MTVRFKALGRVRGAWAASTQYLRGDVVSYLGALYDAKNDFTSTTTFDATNWDLMLAAATSTATSIGFGLPTTSGRNEGDLHYDKFSGREYALVLVGSTLTWSATAGNTATVGSGLPGFGGRILGDIHYDQSTGKTGILTGAPGGSVVEPFSYADGNLTGQTASNGNLWEAGGNYIAGGSTPLTCTIASGRGVMGNASSYGNLIVVGSFGLGGEINVSVTDNPAAPGGAFYLAIGGKKTDFAKLFVQIQSNDPGVFGQGLGRILVYYQNAAGATTTIADNGSNQAGFGLRTDVDTKVSLRLSADGTVGVYYNDVLKISGTLTSAQMATLGTCATLQGNSQSFDNLSTVAYGTQAWTFTEPIYLQAQLALGNVATGTHVLKPGVRVPTDATLREMILRADTAPTGASITVQAERFNNGVSQGVIATASIVAGATVGSVTGLSAACAKGDILRFNITSVGSTVTGADLTASLDFH